MVDRRIIIPQQNARSGRSKQSESIRSSNIKEVIEFFNNARELEPTVVNTREEFYQQQTNCDLDFAEVKGQENVKRALEVAAAGGHNLIMVGAPGSGKSMLAKRLPSILPPLSLGEVWKRPRFILLPESWAKTVDSSRNAHSAPLTTQFLR